MENVLVVLAVLACPLMMLAMGGMAWAGAKFRNAEPAENPHERTDVERQ
jgi:hypothetical protein